MDGVCQPEHDQQCAGYVSNDDVNTPPTAHTILGANAGSKCTCKRSCKRARNVTLQDQAFPGFNSVAVTLWTTILVLLLPLQ